MVSPTSYLALSEQVWYRQLQVWAPFDNRGNMTGDLDPSWARTRMDPGRKGWMTFGSRPRRHGRSRPGGLWSSSGPGTQWVIRALHPRILSLSIPLWGAQAMKSSSTAAGRMARSLPAWQVRARALSGAKAGRPQRAKVGYCFCCTRATRVAVPARYVAGEFSNGEARGLAQWVGGGPWAPRRYAALGYAQDKKSLQTH